MTRSIGRPRLVSAALCLAAACAGEDAPAPIVTEPVRHAELELTPAGTDLGGEAPAYVGDRVGLAEGDALVLLTVRTGPDGLRHARLRQEHRGVPVHGSEIAAHADATTFLGFGGRITRNLGSLDLAPAFDRDAALATARATGTSGVVYDLERATLFIRPRGPEGADLVWHVELFNSYQPRSRAAAWNVVLDASTGDVLRRYNAMHTLDQASGPGGNDKVSWTWNGELDVEEDGGEYLMETDRMRTLDGSKNDEVVRGADIANMEDKAANDAHGFAEATLGMMSDWAGQDSLDGSGFVIVSRVHDTTACGPDNACWYMETMHYGDGAPGGAFHPFSGGIDVVGHELNHGFTDFHSDLVYSEQSGGLNESFSDVAGTMVEFYREGEGADFLVGENITTGVEPLRTMCEPSKDAAFWLEHADYWESLGIDDLTGFVSIEHASEYTAGMDPHWSSGPPNKAFCLAVGRAKAHGLSTVDSVRRVGQAWYAANAGYWTSATTYDEGCQGIVDAGRALGFSDEEVTEIAQSWADVGVTCDAGSGGGGGGGVCDGDGSCDTADGETCASCADCGACPLVCGPFQMAKCAQGIGDCSQCGAIGCGDGVCAEGEDDASCAADCGCSAEDSCGSVAPWGCWCDDECAASGDCCADVAVCGG